MRQYQVPQFITIEDRIIGPLTLKQFLYLLGGGGLAVLGWTFLHPIIFFIAVMPFVFVSVALAFLKISGRPLPQLAIAAINYFLKPRLYLWKKSPVKKRPTVSLENRPSEGQGQSIAAAMPKPSQSKLNDLAWSLDIKEKVGRE